MNSTQSITISQLRQNTAAVIDQVIANQTPAVILQRSVPRAVLVDVDYYEALEEAVLDASDSKEIVRAKNESRRPFSDYVKKRWGTRGV